MIISVEGYSIHTCITCGPNVFHPKQSSPRKKLGYLVVFKEMLQSLLKYHSHCIILMLWIE